MLAIAALFEAAPSARAELNVVAATQDLASIAQEIGGDKIKVTPMAKGYQDPHFVEAKPSFVLTLNRADLLIVVGRDLEIGWLPPLITQSRNAKIQPGSKGYLDPSQTAKILELPTGTVTRAMGDVHPLGNPHYWLDPENGRRIAQAIKDRLSELDAANAAYYAQREADFSRRLTEAQQRWKAQMAPYKGLKVITYHRSWANFAEAFGLDVVGFVEPKPGVPPSAGYLGELVTKLSATPPRVILLNAYNDPKAANWLSERVHAPAVVLPFSVGGSPGAKDLFGLYDDTIDKLLGAAK